MLEKENSPSFFEFLDIIMKQGRFIMKDLKHFLSSPRVNDTRSIRK